MRRAGRATLAALALAAFCAAPATAAPGPPLREPTAALDAALECSPGVTRSARTPVLLVHGTGANSVENWSWGYRRVLPQIGFPTCTVDLPQRGVDDMQRNVEYVVRAIRRISARRRGKISVMGQSQGALLPVLALRFWPDLADMVDDSFGMSAPFQGSRGADFVCRRSCIPSFHQFRPRSRFNAAFAAKAQPREPSYTSVASRGDQIAFPQPWASRLRGATNLMVQDVCPGRPADHFTLAGDAVVYALALDALSHPGATNPARFLSSTCAQTAMPGADLVGLSRFAGFPLGFSGETNRTSTPAEPPLRCFMRRNCANADARGRLLSAARLRRRSLRNRRSCAGRCRPRSTVLGVRSVEPGRLRIRLERRRRGRWRPASARTVELAEGRRRVRIRGRVCRRRGSRVRCRDLPAGRYRMLLDSRTPFYRVWARERVLRLAIRRR